MFLRCSRCVPVDDEPAANEDLGENAPDDDDQVQATGDSRVELRPSFDGPVQFSLQELASTRCAFLTSVTRSVSAPVLIPESPFCFKNGINGRVAMHTAVRRTLAKITSSEVAAHERRPTSASSRRWSPSLRGSNSRWRRKLSAIMQLHSVQSIRLLTFTRTVDSAPFNPEIDLQRTGKLDPTLDPVWSTESWECFDSDPEKNEQAGP